MPQLIFGHNKLLVFLVSRHLVNMMEIITSRASGNCARITQTRIAINIPAGVVDAPFSALLQFTIRTEVHSPSAPTAIGQNSFRLALCSAAALNGDAELDNALKMAMVACVMRMAGDSEHCEEPWDSQRSGGFNVFDSRERERESGEVFLSSSPPFSSFTCLTVKDAEPSGIGEVDGDKNAELTEVLPCVDISSACVADSSHVQITFTREDAN